MSTGLAVGTGLRTAGIILWVGAGCIGSTGGSGGKNGNGTVIDTGGATEIGAVQVQTLAGTTGRGGTWDIPVEIAEAGGVFQIDAARPDGGLISTEFLYSPDGDTLVSWEDWTGRFGLTDAFFVNDNVTVFSWPIRDSDPDLVAGEYRVGVGAVDENYRYEAGIDIDVTLYWRPHPAQRTLSVILLYAAGLEQDRDVVAAMDAGVARWQEIYADAGITLDVRSDTIDMDANLPSLYRGSDALEAYYAGVDDLAVPVIIGDLIANDELLYGEAGGIPGPLIPSRRSGVVLSWLTCAGGDGAFSDDDIELLAETFAHEVGHYLGAYHPVESNYRSWDALEDTPACEDWRACEDAMQDNLMFPYPLCTRNGCVDQDQLTDEQGGVLSRFMGVK